MVRAIRGAITADKNTNDDIMQATKELITAAINENNIDVEDIISINFTMTSDLTKGFPCAAVRQLGITDVPLLDYVHPDVDGALKKCIRLMMYINSDKSNKDLKHIYLKGARALRPDIAKGDFIAVAVDGPAGAGKSSVSKAAAKELGFLYIDTGAMYRAAALFAIENGIDIVKNKLQLIDLLDDMDIKISYDNSGQRVYLNGTDVTDDIRTNDVTKGASNIAKIPEVRTRLVGIQRDMAKQGNVIMDGRDICTVVLPDAQIKVFLTASVEARAKRRYRELMEKGMDTTFETVRLDIIARDKNDSERAASPLVKADDAVLFDTSNMDFDEVVSELIRMVKDIM